MILLRAKSCLAARLLSLAQPESEEALTTLFLEEEEKLICKETKL